MTKKINRFYSSVLNRIKRQYKDSTTNEELLELRQKSENDVMRFLETGETTFFRKALIFGEEQMIEIMLEQSLAILRVYSVIFVS